MVIDKIIEKIVVWDSWAVKYKEFVPQFIEEAINKNTWKEWDKKVFTEFFEKNRDQCVSSLQQGYYTNIEKSVIKENWSALAPLLRKIASQQDELDLETYSEVKKWFRKHTSQNRKASVNRLIASLQPELLCSIVNESSLKVLMQKINQLEPEANLKISGNWFLNSNTTLNYFKNKMPSKNIYDIMTYPWQTYEILTEKKITTNTNEMSDSNELGTIKELLNYKKQIILQGPPGTGKTRLAKELAVTMLELENVKDLNDNEQFKLIQFHPSYTYEDFVRGIVAKPNENGEGIVYEAENKTLGAFAKEALKNYKASIDTSAESDIEIWIDSTFEDFKNEIEKDIEEKEIELSGDITLFKVQSDSFRYGKNWDNPSRINFSDFKYLIKNIIEKRFALSNQQITKEFSVHAHYRYTYYNALLKIFFEKYKYNGESYSESKKNYILIIDEINRANLSSVLGELIYALEYRGEAVESMYNVDGYELILPPNLYIIGTMNTADRSVGHIDYAIRRRFAFVDVLPKDLSEDETIVFDHELFKSINVLFTTDNYITRSSYLSTDFEPKDVALGHSYFIDKTNEGGSMPTRWQYEIKPILLEYIKDGILKEPARAKITEIDESFLNA